MISLRAHQTATPSPSGVTAGHDAVKGIVQLDRIEQMLMETKGRILRALDRELETLRAMKTVREVPAIAQLPNNVLEVGREFFTTPKPPPVEAMLDPALEKATIEELNAALAAAFSQMSSH